MQRRTVLLISSQDVGWADLRVALQTLEDVDVLGEAETAHLTIHLATIAGVSGEQDHRFCRESRPGPVLRA